MTTSTLVIFSQTMHLIENILLDNSSEIKIAEMSFHCTQILSAFLPINAGTFRFSTCNDHKPTNDLSKSIFKMYYMLMIDILVIRNFSLDFNREI